MSSLHRVRRTVWSVRTPDAATALAARQLLRRAHETQILPALEASFDAADDGRVRRLPALQVNLKVVSLAALADDLPALVEAAVEAALREAMQADPVPASGVVGETSLGDDRTEALSTPTPASRLWRYLRTGQLAWFDAGAGVPAASQSLQETAAAWSAVPDSYLAPLLALGAELDAADVVLFRFLNLLSPADRAVWLAVAARHAALPLALYPARDALLMAAQQLSGDAGVRCLVLALLANAALPAGAVDAPSAVVLGRAAAACDALRLASPAMLGAAGELIDAALGGLLLDGAAPGRALTAGPQTAPVTVSPEFQKAPIFRVSRNPAPGMPVAQAGLVLLHAWLPHLLTELGWIAAPPPRGTPLPWAVLPKALALLHWLATGHDAVQEHALGTAKLLLGLDPDQALPVGAGLLDGRAQAEGESLLQALIGHWPALGQTSIEGLRMAFLQRPGLLHAVDDGWCLRPQPEAYDVLLDRLPWGIGLIRLPWMTSFLHIEWTAT